MVCVVMAGSYSCGGEPGKAAAQARMNAAQGLVNAARTVVNAAQTVENAA